MPDSRLAKSPDAVALAQAMIRCPSVTPEEAGVLAVLDQALRQAGFATRRLDFAEPGTPDIANLYASIGSGSPHFCFAGHVDVVPVGDLRAWTVDPFAADIIDGTLYGRGAAVSKSDFTTYGQALRAALRAASRVRAPDRSGCRARARPRQATYPPLMCRRKTTRPRRGEPGPIV